MRQAGPTKPTQWSWLDKEETVDFAFKEMRSANNLRNPKLANNQRMGRQIHFYMKPEDRDAFLSFARQHDPVEIILRDGDSSEVHPIVELNADGSQTLCLWNRSILRRLRRKWIREPGYYRVDEFREPVLEFTPSLVTSWEGRPALIQSRLYGIFEGKPPEFEKWYERLVRWIRKNYKKNPTSTGGYVGHLAYQLFENGGYLLPQFLPPRTEEWLAEIGKQHAGRPNGRVAGS